MITCRHPLPELEVRTTWARHLRGSRIPHRVVCFEMKRLTMRRHRKRPYGRGLAHHPFISLLRRDRHAIMNHDGHEVRHPVVSVSLSHVAAPRTAHVRVAL